ncbi:MaoC family dehydratase [Solwaraspora sp. WMMB335]|uniref:MaoC family dehydratase n=1 Tax=Solwaraspora sp. WMMB335 TaxID=3404118 RepID=UPI003B95A03B
MVDEYDRARPVQIVELDQPPPTGALLRRAALGALPGLPGLAGLGGGGQRGGDELPRVEYRLSGLLVSRDHLADYDQVCGFRLADTLPATYPHVLAFPLALTLLSAPDFPFPLAGLVHVANQITNSRRLDAAEPLDLAVRAQRLRDHPRGRQFDLVATASVDDEVVWRGVSTYLRREGPRRRPTDRTATATPGTATPGTATPAPPGGSARWRVPVSVGTRYARISGDHNPIHTSALGARVFGYRRRIAHGMWMKARCLAALQGRLPDSSTVAVEFRAPMLLPATVSFATARTGAGWEFTLRQARTDRTQLTGTVQPLS